MVRDNYLKKPEHFVSMVNIKTLTSLRLFTIGILLIGIADLPYGYYTLLRIIVCIVSCITAFIAFGLKKKLWLWIFIGIVLIFNPIIPIYFNKDTWIILDVVIAGIFGYSIIVLK